MKGLLKINCNLLPYLITTVVTFRSTYPHFLINFASFFKICRTWPFLQYQTYFEISLARLCDKKQVPIFVKTLVLHCKATLALAQQRLFNSYSNKINPFCCQCHFQFFQVNHISNYFLIKLFITLSQTLLSHNCLFRGYKINSRSLFNS